MALDEFVKSFLEAHDEEVEEIIRLIDLVKDMTPSNAFYFTVSATCNEEH